MLFTADSLLEKHGLKDGFDVLCCMSFSSSTFFGIKHFFSSSLLLDDSFLHLSHFYIVLLAVAQWLSDAFIK